MNYHSLTNPRSCGKPQCRLEVVNGHFRYSFRWASMCDMTWCDLTWRDVTWRDVTRHVCYGRWCDVMWHVCNSEYYLKGSLNNPIWKKWMDLSDTDSDRLASVMWRDVTWHDMTCVLHNMVWGNVIGLQWWLRVVWLTRLEALSGPFLYIKVH